MLLLLPLTAQTENFMNARRFKAMKKSGYLLNFGRGGLIVDEALVQAVKDRTIAAAVLDVFRKEPLPAGHAFRTTPGITVLPHIGGYQEGRAEVDLDGKKSGVLDAYIVERTHDNALWHTYGLKPGEHTLRIVTLADADPRSKGHQLTIDRAVIYRSQHTKPDIIPLTSHRHWHDITDAADGNFLRSENADAG